MVVGAADNPQRFGHRFAAGVAREFQHESHGVSQGHIALGKRGDVADQADALRQGERLLILQERSEHPVRIEHAVVAGLPGIGVGPFRAPLGLAERHHLSLLGHQGAFARVVLPRWIPDADWNIPGLAG